MEHALRPEPDRDRDRQPALRGGGAEARAQLPRVVQREGREPQLGVLGHQSIPELAHGRSSTLIARRSSIAAYASAASRSGSSRSNTLPGWMAPDSTSGSSSSMYPRTGATPPLTPMLRLNSGRTGSSGPPFGAPT